MSDVQRSLPNPGSRPPSQPLVSFSSWSRQTWGLVAAAFAAAVIVL